ncbi:hypothetical protein HK405_014812, partial [Cladochytrium tenue]
RSWLHRPASTRACATCAPCSPNPWSPSPPTSPSRRRRHRRNHSPPLARLQRPRVHSTPL